MGIIFLFILIFVIIIIVNLFIDFYKQFILKSFKYTDYIIGLLISIGIFVIICFSYIIQDNVWKLSPAFRFPIFMIFIPYIFYEIINKQNILKLKYLSKLLLLNIITTLLLSFFYIKFLIYFFQKIETKMNY